MSLQDEQARYLIGIDLGTTNSALAYIDSQDRQWAIRDFAIPQLVAPGEIEARPTLASFHYEAAGADDLRLPWDTDRATFAVGHYARNQAGVLPGRTVVSAKSWLSHAGVDRNAALLPWHASEGVGCISPVTASSRYLLHLRKAWDAGHIDHPLATQDVVLTVPASFDQVARELTVEAARQAGLRRIVLVEEPQAAFYAWIGSHRTTWMKHVRPGETILVCDIGGGTTDFTLIRARPTDKGSVIFHRVAVGEHLILGGDNLDLALAKHAESKMTRLDPERWGALLRGARNAKETLLGREAPAAATLAIAGGGSRLIGGAATIELTRDEVVQVLVDGFLPFVNLSDRPAQRRSGFQELGLPYAADAAITRYLAAFLTTHKNAGLDESADHSTRPDWVLFNGGFFESPILQQRLMEVMSRWFDGAPPKILENKRLDLAVARGAAYYAMVRRGRGMRISGGLAQTYYIGVESNGRQQALCVLPAGTEQEKPVELERSFELRIRTPVEFPLYVSSVRTNDKPGALLDVNEEEMSGLPPIRTVLQTARNAPAEAVSVKLNAKLTEIGTLDLWLGEIGNNRQWTLAFDVRSTHQSDAAIPQREAEGVIDDQLVQRCANHIADVFAAGGAQRPASLVKQLEEIVAQPRADWPAAFMRAMWKGMMDVEPDRRLSQEHETRWLNMTGYCLRPGYGLAVDDWRVAQTWKLFAGGLRFPKNEQTRAEWWVLWRRLAGGMVQGQQNLLAEPLLAAWRAWLRKQGLGLKWQSQTFQFGNHESNEAWRLLGSLELLRAGMKEEIGAAAFELLQLKRMNHLNGALLFALGRLGARVPVYGPLNLLLPGEMVMRWIDRLLAMPDDMGDRSFALMQLARKTGDRALDIDDQTRDRVIAWLVQNQSPEHYVQLVRQGGHLETQEQRSVFGESLPVGLRID